MRFDLDDWVYHPMFGKPFIGIIKEVFELRGAYWILVSADPEDPTSKDKYLYIDDLDESLLSYYDKAVTELINAHYL